MSAVLMTHRCPLCPAEVIVYAKDAIVYHRCEKAPLRAKMTTFRVVTPDGVESQRKPSRSLSRGSDNGTAR